MAESDPQQRHARIVLVKPAGAVIGALPPIPVATPWWQDIGPVVAAVRTHYGLDVTILRLLDTERDRMPGGLVTYLAETTALTVDAAPWSGTLTDHPLRQSYAKPGGPAADLAWATEVLAGRGLVLSGPPAQVRTWNLSSLWRLPVAGGDAWLKAVPSFFAHEGAMLDLLAGEPVPHLLGRDGSRIVLAAVPGEDLYDAQLPTLLRMVELLVGLQRKFIGRTGELLSLGLPDWRAESLATAIARVVERNRQTLTAVEAATLSRFVDRLPARFAEIGACGIPDTLVHGDFHPGNLRGDGETLTLLDWGDSGVGHPLLDQAAFLDRVPPDAVAPLREHWSRLWQAALPGANTERAADLLAPIAAARQAIIYQTFLDGIEPSEQVYHRHDPANWLRTAAARLG